MGRRLVRAWPAVAAAAFALVAGLDAAGLLARLERAVADTRAALLAHERESDIVIVGIDTQSLDALGQWPWPRRYHANLVRAISSAKPASIFLDIDFSSRAPDASDDDALEAALAAATAPVYLAAHFDESNDAHSYRTPLPRFARHARLASVVLRPNAGDSLVRDMRGSWSIDTGDAVPTELLAIFAHDDARWRDRIVRIDYSIVPESFPYASYIDVANRAIADEALRGKRVFVGAVANGLGDILQVPVQGALPGVVVQALAVESARTPLYTLPGWLGLVGVAALAALAAFLFDTRAWRMNLLFVGGGLVLLGAATLYLEAAHRVILDVVPYALVLAVTFVACALRSLDREHWRALANALRVRRRDALLKSIVESSSDCIVCVDASLVIRTANPAALRLFGRGKAAGPSVVGASLGTLIPDLDARHGGSLEPLAGRVVECTANTGGDAVPVEMAVSRIEVSEDTLYTAIIRDVSERHAQRRALEHQATHDSLTGLPNRAALNAHLERLLGEGRAAAQPIALLMLDLTRFKEVNDTLGHDVGDEVLCEVAVRFAERLGEAFIARIGGDEFTVVVQNVARRDSIDELAKRLIDGLRRPIVARGIAIEVGVNIGVAFAPNDALTAKDLLRRADVAMYVAKRRGTGCEHYDSGHDQHTVRRLSMLSELRSAIESSGISLHYQPQVDLRRNRITSVEALVRWQHAMHGAIGPAEFVTLAESSDLIGPLTDWTITRTLQDLAAWQRQHLDLRAAVNVSARVLQDVDFPARVRELLAASSVRADRLELEITESAMMVDPDRARRIVDELHALGVAISIDDYGTGFSSLGYLRDLRVHALKLDRSFVIDLDTRTDNRVIVESTVQMAHALGLVVVAEGVESESVAQYLRDAGYDLAQGYWFARPMPADDCLRFALKYNSAKLQLVG